MIRHIRVALFFVVFLHITGVINSQAWRDEMAFLTYSPRYFGPSAFPIPELHNGRIPDSWELELRGELHGYSGDRTRDVFMRLFVPIVRGRASIEVSGVLWESYETTEETRLERHAASRVPLGWNFGDIIISSRYQLLRTEKWGDITLSSNLKTASGGRLCDARFTDAATYWFEMTYGHDVLLLPDYEAFIRMQGMAGFYCWMTNSMVHRQNDAILYGIGVEGGLKNTLLTVDYAGFSGYRHNGDRSAALRLKLEYELRDNVISLRYRHGMRDNLYTSYSVGYIRRF